MKFSSLLFASLAYSAASATSDNAVQSDFERALAIPPPEYECLDKYVKLSFSTATLTVNNLGNKGPQTGVDPIMLFEGVGTFDNKKLNLEVKIKDGFDYVGFNVRMEKSCGLRHGVFLKIKPSKQNVKDFKTKVKAIKIVCVITIKC